VDEEGPGAPPEIRPPGVLARLRPHLLDVTPLRRSPDLRRLVLAQAVSEFGNQATLVAIPFQVYAITRSTVAVGLVALAELVPTLALAPIGGAIADTVDRRRLTLVANAVFAVLSLGLAANAFLADPYLWPLYVFAFAAGGVFALSVASVRAWPARLVPSELLPAAFAIEGAAYSANALVGPAVAGLLIGVAGVAAAYLLDIVTFLVAVVVIAGMGVSRPDRRGGGLASIFDGFRTVRRHKVVATILGLDFTAMLFGMPLALLPALAVELGVGPGVLGLLYAAPAVGGLIAAGLSGAAGRARRPGWGVLLSLAGWSAGIVITGLADVAWLAMLGLAVAGAGNELSALLGTAITQSVVQDDVRGRIAGIDHLVSSAGPALGDIESGIVASWIGVGNTIVLGGGLAFVGVAILGAVGRRLRLVSDLSSRPLRRST
jgi:MFS family permease